MTLLPCTIESCVTEHYDADQPVLGFDERSLQLVDDARPTAGAAAKCPRLPHRRVA